MLPFLISTVIAIAASSTVTVTLPADRSDGNVLGRVRVFILRGACRPGASPPITSCGDDQDTAQVFGEDTPAGGLAPGASVQITADSLGYPYISLLNLEDGEYCMQADLNLYEVFVRGDGVNVTLPTTCVSPGGGDGAYGLPPGTLYSKPKTVTLHVDAEVALSLTELADPHPSSPGCSGKGADTEWIKTVRVTSKLLSAFWGKPIVLEACVLLPYGFNEHPNAKYPLAIAHGHYSATFNPGGRFDPTPPSANLTGYAFVDQQYANWLYGNWTSAEGPFKGARALMVTINHPVPFFDDSYAVDSVNVGPYGSAIMTELLPAIEGQYRGLGAGWARGVMGGSTGGWESFAVQVLYPDDFNYAAVACPDPIGFTSYTTVNIYEAKNAYFYDAPFKRTARPGQRDHYSGTAVIPGTSIPTYGSPYGQTTATVEEMNRREIVLGPRSRSCGQWDIWEAVFGPRGEDGYPKRLWCKDPRDTTCEYGAIDPQVAQYWKEHFDMTDKLKREWAHGLGAKLSGKLHVFVGASDTFFLTNAVMDLQDWATNATLDPPFGGEIVIGAHDGRGYEHCFNGFLPDGTIAPNAITRELYVTKFVPRMAERWAASAPKGADMEWHSY